MQSHQSPYCRCVSFLLQDLEQLPLHIYGNEATLHFAAAPGLYQFAAIADGSDFDWESLYINLFEDGNKGRRTGPWDFDLTNGNRPLVPAFRVTLDGEYLGLWFFQRISLADLQAKRFRGRMAFHIDCAGEHELRFTAYHENPLSWSLARLEGDPEDVLLPEVKSTFLSPPPAARWAEETFWQQKRKLLRGAARDIFQQHLDPLFRNAIADPQPPASSIPFLLAAWRLDGNAAALESLEKAVENTVALPHWNNPHEDGYGHDGDMGAAMCLRHLAWIYRATERENPFNAGLRERLLRKVLLQGNRFLQLALLNRDYWGGSVLQDHGWRSFFQFGDAVLHLLGIIPEAELWARYVLPRIDRSLQAMPRDGVIPPSSYCLPHNYLDVMAHYRDARLAFDGDDIYDRTPVEQIPQYLHAVLRAADGVWMTSCRNIGGDTMPFFGGGLFWAQLAERGNSLAGPLCRLSLQHTTLEGHDKHYQGGLHQSVLSTLLGTPAGNPLWQEETPLPSPPPVSYFADSGLVHYRDLRNDITFAVRCGPHHGYHAEAYATGPSDQMMIAPDSGHFILARGSHPFLTTPDFGYSLRTAFRSCLLIDGQGQNADVGYPMSIPSQPYCGGHIETVQWNEKAAQLRVALNLTRAYPKDLGVLFYTREFFIDPKVLLVRDEISLDERRRLSWYFQSKREYGIAINETDLSAQIGGANGFLLRATAPELPLQISRHETEVVWSYVSNSGFRPFDHVRYETQKKDRHALVEFRFNWQ
jgi:hypothetical protein